MLSSSSTPNQGIKDIALACNNYRLALYLAWADIKQRYKRSTIGPFWITISTAIMICCLGLIFGKLFKTPLDEFLPFLTAGTIIWGYISTSIIEATNVFPTYTSIIRQLPIPLFTHVMRMVFRNFYILLHNIIVLPFVYLAVGKGFTSSFFWVFPGLALLTLNLFWLSLLLALLGARFRDMKQIVASVVQILFYVTPIIWLPSLMPARSAVMFINTNPFFHLIEIVRRPLLCQPPVFLNWAVSGIFCLSGIIFTVFIFNCVRKRVAYWL